MKKAIISLSCIGAAVVGFFCFFVNPLDVLTDNVTVIAQTKLPNGEVVEWIQKWAGDGYWTGVRHIISTNNLVFACADPDFRKIWHCSPTHDPTHAKVAVTAFNHRWVYYYNIRSLHMDDGKSIDAQ